MTVMMRPRWRLGMTVLVLLLTLILMVGFSLSLGAARLPFGTVWRIVFSKLPLVGRLIPVSWDATAETIILAVRLPRIILGLLVGAALSVAGAGFQGLLQNPLADPYTLGVSSGAAVGASFSILFNLSGGPLGFSAVPFFAFIGAVLSLWAVYNLARVGRKVPIATLLLSGVVVSAFLSSVISFAMLFAGKELRDIMYWLMGGLSRANWLRLAVITPYCFIGMAIIFSFSRELNIMLLGEETALSLGVEVEKLKLWILLTASLLTAAAVSLSGLIGFIGLIVPHVTRLLFGPDFQKLVPLSALIGGIFLIAADTFARVVVAPAEIPVGVITAFLGAPFFALLLRKKRLEFFL